MYIDYWALDKVPINNNFRYLVLMIFLTRWWGPIILVI